MAPRPARTLPTPPPPPDHTSPNAPRFEILPTQIHVFGYPTDQGDGANVVALEDVSAVDLEFLSLPWQPLNNPIWEASRNDPKYFSLATHVSVNDPIRYQDQATENDFCRRLLRLGARRWETLDRFRFVLGAVDHDDLVMDKIEGGFEPAPVSEERCWAAVAWPSAGGVCVAEVPRMLVGIGDQGEQSVKQEFMMDRRSVLKMAKNMDEKADVLLVTFEGKMYSSIDEVDSSVLRRRDLALSG
ncbi:hypothetical protein K4K48_001708 [Colletotrichum sp. SAR 10_66]|nr:hypothetical protein K4K48_001708 [Colletotrichum sp. SAR 10_66]